jgi:hypothetical protein
MNRRTNQMKVHECVPDCDVCIYCYWGSIAFRCRQYALDIIDLRCFSVGGISNVLVAKAGKQQRG